MKMNMSPNNQMLMNQINRLNNNNAIVKNKFNEIERQIDTISKKSEVRQGFGSSNNINKELDIIKKELYDYSIKCIMRKSAKNFHDLIGNNLICILVNY